jgi:hypothetical protein
VNAVPVVPGAGWDDGLIVGHCGAQDLTLVRAHATWQGEHELATQDFTCNVCRAEITIVVRRHVGPPAGLPGERR